MGGVGNILDEVVASVKEQYERRKRIVSSLELRLLAQNQKSATDVFPILEAKSADGGAALIAEVKRASPSKGWILDFANAGVLAREYELAGASVISVLTEEQYFKGSLNDIKSVRKATSLPILRKDFIVDEYQILEARAYGADMVLLIAAVFDLDNNGGTPHFRKLLEYVHSLGMRALVECHTVEEIKISTSLGAKIIGINARNLKTFEVDTTLFAELADALPGGVVKVAESGVQSAQDVVNCMRAGADALLVGESLVRSTNRQVAAEELVRAAQEYRRNSAENISTSSSTAPLGADLNSQNVQQLSTLSGPHFGTFGGRFVPEALVPALDELETAYEEARADEQFNAEFRRLLNEYVGRPSKLTSVPNFAAAVGQWTSDRLSNSKTVTPRIFLKREDLNHTGAHKINNALGQALLAQRLGKRRIIAETGAGQHGVATATVCALLNMECVVYMGEVDAKRQTLNVARMELLDAKVVRVKKGSRILKDAINEALRDWVGNIETTHYLLGTAAGPHPFPTIVRDFQKVIGEELREQLKHKEIGAIDAICACVGGGSNAIGIFNAFLDDEQVALYGIEAGGSGLDTGMHATRFSEEVEGAKNIGSKGVFQGAASCLLQDENGQTLETHSISAGLDYASVGPEHAYLREIGRVKYSFATDDEAMHAFRTLCKLEGIIPALESSHALAGCYKVVLDFARRDVLSPTVVINLSGRGDKDVITAGKYFGILQQENEL
ncbi:MAG: tryptophan synthase subunit beta [Candidatus Ancillula trichonymphae]|jgi:tryptophan synthase beta chain|nr:tryptophan synthase subunit beta [Candidatus Ancillula trichonymphae]